MKYEDWMASDTVRAISKILPLDDPNNPISVARAAAAAEPAEKAADARKPAEAAAAPAAANSKPEAEEIQKLERIEKLVEAIDPSVARKRRKRRVRRRVPRVPQDETPLERHQRLCTICDHEDREDIEADFLNWLPADDIADTYDLDRHAVYRHARATGLFAGRERNLRGALGLIVERASSAQVTAGNVLRAIRAYSCLDHDGRWTDPPAHVVVSSGAQLAQAEPAAAGRSKIVEVLPPGNDPSPQPAANVSGDSSDE